MRHVFVHRFQRKVGLSHRDILVAFIASRELDPGAVAGELENEVDARLVPDELIIVSRESVADDVSRAFDESGPFRRLRERLLDGTPTTLISFGGNGAEGRRQLLTKGSDLSDLSLATILRRGSTAIFTTNGGFVESTSAYHFRNPSGRHTSRFMRLSNILVRQAEITYIALSVLQHVPETTRTMYVDTPSLFAVVAALNDLRSSEAALSPVPVDSFRSYDHVRTYKNFQTENAVALVSASSSGSLARLLVDRGFSPQAVVHILFLGERPSDLIAAVDLEADEEENPEGYTFARENNQDDDCTLCRNGSLPITLEGDQFDIAGPQPEPLVITRTTAHNSLRETMSRHAGTKTFRVNGGRPVRQYSVDPEQVASSGKALERLKYLAAARVPGRIGHCIAANESSFEFAKRVLAAAGSSAPILSPDEFEKRVISSGNGFEEPILVAAAVVGSGRQLLDISRRLRSCPKAPLVYFAGIVTTTSTERTKTLESSLALTTNPASHPLIIVDQINLPSADAPNAWERELALLDEVTNTGMSVSPEIRDRQARLRRTSVALEDDLFLANTTSAPLRLRPGFAFWTEAVTDGCHTQADVYYTITAVLQGLRTAEGGIGKKTLRTEWFYRTLLSPENFGRFNDAVIQASLLRAGRPSELDYTDNRVASADAARLIRRIVESAATPRGEAAAEFLMALAIGRLRLVKSDLRTLLGDLPSQTPLVDQLAELCRARLL